MCISIAVFEDMCIKNYAARQASDVALWKVDLRGREGGEKAAEDMKCELANLLMASHEGRACIHSKLYPSSSGDSS